MQVVFAKRLSLTLEAFEVIPSVFGVVFFLFLVLTLNLAAAEGFVWNDPFAGVASGRLGPSQFNAVCGDHSRERD